MRLSLQTFSSLVENMAASVQSSPARLVDLTAGSALRAVLEAGASAGLWMQWLIVQVLQTTRAATSTGADLDTWTADFSFERLPAQPSSGVVTFSRYAAAAAAAIPLGALVRTSDASQTFAVVASPGNANFVASANGYVVPAGTSSIDVPVVAQTSGAAGNVLGGTVTLIATAIQGIDAVTNAAGFSDGTDAESDAAVRARFQSFIDTRSRATPRAVSFAIASVQQGLSWTLQENVDPAGAARAGNFVVTVDDGSGAPSSSLLASVTAAIDAVRPVGSTFSAQPPAVLRADVSMALAVGAGRASPDVAGAVAQAVTAYVATLPLGASLSVSRLAHVAYTASPAVTNVYGVTINGAASDLAASASAVIKPGTVAVS